MLKMEYILYHMQDLDTLTIFHKTQSQIKIYIKLQKGQNKKVR